MKEFLLRIQSQFQKYWQALTGPQRIAVTALGALILVSLIGFTFWTTRPDYSVLFSNLSPQDASSIIEELKEANTPYRITQDGDTILVPTRSVYELRISLAGQGLPQGGGVGFEIFDQNFFGMTEFTQKLNYQRALQGELERTIRQMSGVQGARVHLVIPKKELFVEEEKDPSASVLLKLEASAKLEKAHVQAIANLVKTSVEGLKNENISIVDTRGEILSDVLEDDFQVMGTVTDVFKMKKRIERDLQEEVRLLLERIVGIGNVAVLANVELNMDKQESTKEEYAPVVDEQGIVRSQHRESEFFKGSSGSSGGVPGVESNLSTVPGYVQSGGGEGSSDYTREQVTTNYEINKTLSHISSLPGEIKKISISVLLDGEFPSEKLQSIEQLVSSGVGIQQDRGDQVTVQSFAFDKSFKEGRIPSQEQFDRKELRNMLIKAGVIVLVSVIVLLFTLSMIRHARLITSAKRQIQESQGKVSGAPGLDIEDVEESFPSEEDDEFESMKRQVREIAQQDPERIANAIKALLAS
ncbi:MAG: flagellar M-ring protein FliF [Candidatus Omnitrophica bacterium]|nr:flagellar M-ring protein FliF [Candidatus Omnitrophota bacterium]